MQPLLNIHPDDLTGKCERTASGWFYPADCGLRAVIDGFDDGIICRVAPDKDKEVVQLGIGDTTSYLCNAVYSPSKDKAIVFEADELLIKRVGDHFELSCTGPLTVSEISDYMRVQKQVPWFAPLDRSKFQRPPAGWCSWYCYGLGISEQEIARNTDWLAEHLKPYGCEYVQIDDGWQGRGDGYGSNRDWAVTCESKFPRGMKGVSQYIRDKGLIPGIWLIPFTQSNQEMFREKPEMFLRNADGTSPGELAEPADIEWMPEPERWFDWTGRYFIDPTYGGSDDYLRDLFQMICSDWNYDYIKIDGQWNIAKTYREHRTRLHDQSLDGARIVRHALQVMKSTMGPDKFLLNCGLGFESGGICEGIRTGVDIQASWEGMQNAIKATCDWLFLNTIGFYTDPDTVCVREPLTIEQARAWTALVGITGQLLMASDIMDELPDERVQLLKKIFPVADIHPMELYVLDHRDRPSVFDLKVNLPGVGEWDVVAVFNWSEEPKTTELSTKRLGLPQGNWIVLDGDSAELLHRGNGDVSIELAPTSCRVLSYWPDLGRPQFVGTTRHVTQGAIDTESVTWSEESQELIGVSRPIGEDSIKVRIFLPEGWCLEGDEAARVAEISVPATSAEPVEWRIRCKSN